MTEFPSQAPTDEIAALFPTIIPDVEQLVYQYVHDAAAYGLASGVPALSFYPDRARSATEQKKVDVVRGWPAYPGVVPAVGVAAGPEGEDQQQHTISGGFAGDVVHYDDDGNVVASASYYSQPLTATILVELIHTNRDERDRLHNELRRILFPIRRHLTEADNQILQVSVDAEKTEQAIGPPVSEEPLEMYLSVFTVAIVYEMLEAVDVDGPLSVIEEITVTVDGSDSGP